MTSDAPVMRVAEERRGAVLVLTLDQPARRNALSMPLMAALDAVNARFGRGALRPLSTGLARTWGTRHARLSPRYTTRLDELMEATAL